jgi:hypothetical protein
MATPVLAAVAAITVAALDPAGAAAKSTLKETGRFQLSGQIAEKYKLEAPAEISCPLWSDQLLWQLVPVAGSGPLEDMTLTEFFKKGSHYNAVDGRGTVHFPATTAASFTAEADGPDPQVSDGQGQYVWGVLQAGEHIEGPGGTPSPVYGAAMGTITVSKAGSRYLAGGSKGSMNVTLSPENLPGLDNLATAPEKITGTWQCGA